ncbi:alcohol dehydrogenase [Lactobacillus sp. LC28-10]|uniref:Alcohol dehydrogenase n=1 Tax=Secundilactobacillus angelensis TaxID=2722706 RepID=A0ABX1KYJ2_9LACO|nr:alcohol dehydrogenase [Secundilactobacillus angelensis]MCH5462455.1 alcohol dehydrogenase [Secundilactobacillus angelensis]NLR18063.1 alcohol dehydrogenase [Secundilactobacillus angelensis]
MKRIDLTNQRFGRLTVTGFAGKGKNGNALWNCRCDCGEEIVADGYLLRKGNTKSCGCLRRQRGREAMKSDVRLIANSGNVRNLQQINGTSVVSIMKRRKTNTSGIPGVCYDKQSKRWVARLMIRGKYVLNRGFLTFEEAATARENAVEENLSQVLDRHVKVVQ